MPHPRLRRLLLFPVLVAAGLVPGCGDSGPTSSRPVKLVPRDYPTPQAAVDAAEPGDLVIISPGTYFATEHRSSSNPEFPNGLRAALFLKHGVDVVGDQPQGSVVFRDTTGTDTTYGAVIIDLGLGPYGKVEVNNLTFEDFGIGIAVVGSTAVVRGCRTIGGKAGIWAFRATDPLIDGNLVEGAMYDGILTQYADSDIVLNIVRDCGAGVGAEYPGFPFIAANYLCRNDIGVVANTSVNAFVYRNVIRDNAIYGVTSEAEADPVVIENDLYGNGIDYRVGPYDPVRTDSLDATSNFWDTVDTTVVIHELISDRRTDPTAGAMLRVRPISPRSWNPVPSVNPDALCGADAATTEILWRRLRETAAPPRPPRLRDLPRIPR